MKFPLCGSLGINSIQYQYVGTEVSRSAAASSAGKHPSRPGSGPYRFHYGGSPCTCTNLPPAVSITAHSAGPPRLVIQRQRQTDSNKLPPEAPPSDLSPVSVSHTQLSVNSEEERTMSLHIPFLKSHNSLNR